MTGLAGGGLDSAYRRADCPYDRQVNSPRRRPSAQLWGFPNAALSIAGVGILVFVSACSESSGADDRFTQTWSKSYSATTCSEWGSQMSGEQQFAAAADMLTGARNKGDGGSGLPPDALIEDFQSGLTTSCVVPTMSLAEAGAALYLTERTTFSP